MIAGYNTNGFAHHRMEDTFAILNELGYKSVAVTIDYPLLTSPDRKGIADAARMLSRLTGRYDMRLTIETGARFVLDPRRKHYPNLVSAEASDRQRRIEFLTGAVDLAAETNADSVSFWSGANIDDLPTPDAWSHLVNGVAAVLDHASTRSVNLAFEPEPGMVVERMAQFHRLHGELSEQTDITPLGLTLDVGHIHCLSDGTVGEHVRANRDRLFNIHLEDMLVGTHEHLMFGEGTMDFDAVFSSLGEIEYAGPVHVELSRHSHNAVQTARSARAFLARWFDS